MTIHHRISGVVGGLALLAASGAASASIQSATLTASKDTYVDRAQPNANFGSASELRVRQNNTFFVTFISFDLTALAGQEILGAEFEIFKNSGRGNRSPAVTAITDETFDAWDESTLTWNSVPLGAGDTGQVLPVAETKVGDLFTEGSRIDGATLITMNEANGNNEIQSPIDSTDLVAFLNADTNGVVTLAIHHQSLNGNEYAYRSREGAGGPAPTLRLTFVPTPGAGLLASVACFGLVGRRRSPRS